MLNLDTGYAHRPDDLRWMPGAPTAVRFFNDLGYLVFVVINQSGVARGFYGEAEVEILHRFMAQELGRDGARVHDWRYCPFQHLFAGGDLRAFVEALRPAPAGGRVITARARRTRSGPA